MMNNLTAELGIDTRSLGLKAHKRRSEYGAGYYVEITSHSQYPRVTIYLEEQELEMLVGLLERLKATCQQ